MRNLKNVPENCSAGENNTKLPSTGKFSSSHGLVVPTARVPKHETAADTHR